MVATPLNDVLTSNVTCKSCIIEILGKILEVILLGMKDFDVILIMDWLTAYYTNINCYIKKVALKFLKKNLLLFNLFM